MISTELMAVPPDAGSGLPATAGALLTDRWPAHWITHPAAPKSDYGIYLFRRVIELPAKPGRFVVHVTGDARYRLWVNGHSVCYGPQRCDTAAWRYESLDLAPFLGAGANVLAAEVIGYGDLAPYASMGQRMSFLLQGDTAAEQTADTGAGWKVCHAAGAKPFQADREMLHTFLVVGPGEQLDAAPHPWGWQLAGFDDSSWSAPRVLGNGLPRGWGTDVNYWLAPRSIPLMEETPERLARVVRAAGVEVPAEFVTGRAALNLPAGARASVLFDQGRLTNHVHLSAAHRERRPRGARDAALRRGALRHARRQGQSRRGRGATHARPRRRVPA